jgi:hypothetical protein
MSQRSEFRCDGCGKTATADSFYTLPPDWRSTYSQAEGGGSRHACGADCMVKVLRADATLLEQQESRRRADAEAHAADAERARKAGERRAEASSAEARRRREESEPR